MAVLGISPHEVEVFLFLLFSNTKGFNRQFLFVYKLAFIQVYGSIIGVSAAIHRQALIMNKSCYSGSGSSWYICKNLIVSFFCQVFVITLALQYTVSLYWHWCFLDGVTASYFARFIVLRDDFGMIAGDYEYQTHWSHQPTHWHAHFPQVILWTSSITFPHMICLKMVPGPPLLYMITMVGLKGCFWLLIDYRILDTSEIFFRFIQSFLFTFFYEVGGKNMLEGGSFLID